MAKRNSKVEKVPYQDTVTVLLKKEGQSYGIWSRQVINDICVSVLQGENTEWRNKMLEQASIALIASSIVEAARETNNRVASSIVVETGEMGRGEVISPAMEPNEMEMGEVTVPDGETNGMKWGDGFATQMSGIR